jgi:hypothetical protein
MPVFTWVAPGWFAEQDKPDIRPFVWWVFPVLLLVILLAGLFVYRCLAWLRAQPPIEKKGRE